MQTAVVEVIGDDGLVLVRVTPPWGKAVTLEMDPDHARGLANHIGAAILHVTKGDDMSSDFAAWVQENPAPEPEFRNYETPQESGSFASWLPPSVVRAQHLEEAAEDRQARADERERISRAEQWHDRAVGSYIAAAAVRGEHVTPMDAVNGNVGRDLTEVLADAAARMDSTPDRADERWFGDEGARPAQRSSYPGSEYQLDSLIERAVQGHRDLVAFKARHDYPDALEATRSKSARTPMIDQ